MPLLLSVSVHINIIIIYSTITICVNWDKYCTKISVETKTFLVAKRLAFQKTTEARRVCIHKVVLKHSNMNFKHDAKTEEFCLEGSVFSGPCSCAIERAAVMNICWNLEPQYRTKRNPETDAPFNLPGDCRMGRRTDKSRVLEMSYYNGAAANWRTN